MSEAGASKAKQPLLNALQGLSTLVREAGDVQGADQALELARKLSEDRFQVVVMGEFKRGKSSLINALLGQALLPVAAVPLTSVVTVVRQGAATRAFVEFQGGHRRETAVGSIVEFVSEERNPKNEKRVERVVVETSADFLADGTILVDTPGAGSVYRHNTEVAQKYMPEADAVILVLSVDPPISQTEVEFLHSVRRWVKKLFIVQNKIDYLEPSDLKASLAFTGKVLAEALGQSEATLIPISAKQALQARQNGDPALLSASGLEQLENRLRSFLAAEKGEVLSQAVASRAAAIIDHAVFDINVRLRAEQTTVDEWRMLSITLNERLENAKRRQFELTTLYTAELKAHQQRVEEQLYETVKTAGSAAQEELELYYRSIKAEEAATVREKLNDALMSKVEGIFSGLLERQEPEWNARFEAMTDRYLDGTVTLVNDTLALAAEALKVEAKAVTKPRISVAPPAVWFVVERVSVWTGGFGSLPTLRMFKPFFWKAVRRKIGEALDVNAGRVRYDYSVRLDRAGQQAAGLIEEFFGSSLDAITRALAATADRGESVYRQSAESDAALLERKSRLLMCRAGIAEALDAKH